MSAPHSADALRVGLIGYGVAGSVFHAPFVAATPGLRLAAIVTANPERRRQASTDHPETTLLDSADALWAHAADYDVAVVATPNRTHVPLASAALAAGLHVVVDKPLAPSAAEARRLIGEARERGRLLVPFQNRRWDGDFLTVRRLLDEGALGRPLRFESRFERWRPVPKGGWRESAAPEEAGGTLFDLGSHLIDQALVLFGPVTEVYAEVAVRRAGVDADDDAFLALTHASGVRSHISVSALAAVPGPRLRVLGTAAGYVKRDLDVQEAALRAGARPADAGFGEDPEYAWGLLGAGDEARPVRTERGAYGRFYEGVAAAVRGEGPAPVDPEEVVAGLEVIVAARASSAERRVVRPGGDSR